MSDIIVKFNPGIYFIMNNDAQEIFNKHNGKDGVYDDLVLIELKDSSEKWVNDNIGETYKLYNHIGVVSEKYINKKALSPLQLIKYGWLIKVQRQLCFSYLYDTNVVSIIADSQMRTIDLSKQFDHAIEQTTILNEPIITPTKSEDEVNHELFKLKHPILYRLKCLFKIKDK